METDDSQEPDGELKTNASEQLINIFKDAGQSNEEGDRTPQARGPRSLYRIKSRSPAPRPRAKDNRRWRNRERPEPRRMGAQGGGGVGRPGVPRVRTTSEQRDTSPLGGLRRMTGGRAGVSLKGTQDRNQGTEAGDGKCEEGLGISQQGT